MRLLIAFILAIPSTGIAATLSVGPTQTYTNIDDAIDDASDGDTIEVDAGTYQGALDIDDLEVTIIGLDGSTQTIVQSNSTTLTIDDNDGVTISGLTLQSANGRGFIIKDSSAVLTDIVVHDLDSGEGAGGYVYDSSLTLEDSSFANNDAGDEDGGHLMLVESTITIDNTTFDGGKGEDGGALDITDCVVTITNSNFENNAIESFGGFAPGRGGAIAADASTITVENTTFTDNTAAGECQGGAFHGRDSVVTLEEVTFTGNTNDQLGGAIALERGSAILDVSMTDNIADWRGGAIYALDTELTIEDSDFSTNSANSSTEDTNSNFTGSGGAIWIENSDYSISNSLFTANTADTVGGAIYTDSDGTVATSTFTDNTANYAGALYLYTTGATITNCDFNTNTAGVKGGAIRINSGSPLDITDSAFDGNSAGEEGGALGANNSDVNITASMFKNNSATEEGGAIFIEDGSLKVFTTSIDNNDSSSSGAGIYAGDADLNVSASSFNDNTATQSGGAIRWVESNYTDDLTIAKSTFRGNDSGGYGGAVGIWQGDSVQVTDSTFTDNSSVYGGAMSITQVAETIVKRNWMCSNTAGEEGGGVRFSDFWSSDSEFSNNLFVENSSLLGGGLLANDSAGADLINNTFVGNTAPDGGGFWVQNATLNAVNNLLAYTGDGYGIDQDSSTLNLSYSLGYLNTPDDLNGTTWNSITGNVSGDPLLALYSQDGDCSNDQLWPLAGSPAIDTGDPSILDPNGTTSDIGAYGGPDSVGLADDLDNDGFTVIDDCNDNDATINPGATDDCDGVDNDCDGSIDDGLSWDDDGDGYTSVGSCGGSADDCTDTNVDINPGATEVCDGLDNDCDNVTDGASATDALTFYEDLDLDGFGSDTSLAVDCAVPTGYVDVGGDCNDTDNTINPAADEFCDNIDNNCDGTTDGPDAVDALTYYADADADGYGDNNTALASCSLPTDYVVDNTDCDDTLSDINPTAVEICDGVDNNCDGAFDEGLATATYYADTDLDGYGNPNDSVIDCAQPADTVDNDSDCDDTDGGINPSAIDICEDNIDQDCDGVDASCTGDDSDGDGYCDANICSDNTTPGDCDDTNALIFPGATEVCDQVDNNCDGAIDEGLTADIDGDGFSAPGSCEGSADDCDDTNVATNPDADEICDGADNDCDTDIDEDATDATTYYSDTDGDTYGDAAASLADCSQPTGYVEDATDCDDTVASTYPGAPELCDGADNDCDTVADNGLTFSDWYADTDGDGFGDGDEVINYCDQPADYVSSAGDCDDSNGAINPDADEICNNLDDNCDSVIDDDAIDRSSWYADSDGDGYGDITIEIVSCDAPETYVSDDMDCDDTDYEIYPGAPEECEDTEDKNCDGILPNADTDEDGFISCDDCDDEDPEIYPGATDTPGDGIDSDCDGVDPEADLPGDEEDLKIILAAGGCACDSTTAPLGLGWIWLLPALLFIRRRDHGQYRTA